MRNTLKIIALIATLSILTVPGVWAFMTLDFTPAAEPLILPTLVQLSSDDDGFVTPEPTIATNEAVVVAAANISVESAETGIDTSTELMVAESEVDTVAVSNGNSADVASEPMVPAPTPDDIFSWFNLDFDLNADVASTGNWTATVGCNFQGHGWDFIGPLYDAIYSTATRVELTEGCVYDWGSWDPGNFSGPTAFGLWRDVVIDGNGATLKRLYDSHFRFFYVGAGNVTIENITLVDGDSTTTRMENGNEVITGGDGGAIFIEGGSLTLNNVRIANSTGFIGGAIKIQNGVNVTINDSYIGGAFTSQEIRVNYDVQPNVQYLEDVHYDASNRAYGNGGGIYNIGQGTTLILNNTVVDNNISDDANGTPLYGGGIYNGDRGQVFILDGSVIGDPADGKGNSSTSHGGGIYNTESGVVQVSGSQVNGNLAGYDAIEGVQWQPAFGGGIYNIDNGQVTVQSDAGGSSVIDGNRASDDGGGVFNSGNGTTFTLNNSNISGNTAAGEFASNTGDGGGIFNEGDATVIIKGASTIGGDSLAEGNVADLGGGIYSKGFSQFGQSTVTINEGSRVSYNQSLADGDQPSGAGLHILGGSSLVIVDSFVRQNMAAGWGGGMFIGDSDTIASITRTLIEDNTAVNGGGIYHRAATTSITDGTIQNNSAEDPGADENLGNGGAILNDVGQMTITDITFSMNSTINGSGGALLNRTGNITVLRGQFDDNDAQGGGGAIYNTTAGSVITITDTAFEGNDAYYGGAIANVAEGNITVTNANFDGNDADGLASDPDAGSGGALFNSLNNTMMTLNSVTLINNTGYFGGAIANKSGGQMSLTSTTVGGDGTGNDATDPAAGNDNVGEGGGILNTGQGTTLTISNSLIYGNSTDGEGGGIANKNSELTVQRTAIIHNQAKSGGGVSSLTGDVSLTNVTISTNTSTESGFGAAGFVVTSDSDTDGGQATLTQVTLADNNPSGGGNTASAIGVQKNFGANVYPVLTVTGNVIDGHPNGPNCRQAILSPTTAENIVFTSNGFNVSDDDTCDFDTNGDVTDLENATMLLGALEELAGDTYGHLPDGDSDIAGHIPLSQCVTASDQRGFNRPQGINCESGAIEFVEYSTYVSTPSNARTIKLETVYGAMDTVDIVVTRNGTADFTINEYSVLGDSAISVSGDEAAPFTISDSSDSLTLTITCNGNDVGALYTSTLYVYHDSPAEPDSPVTYDVECEVGGMPSTPVEHTLGLYQAGRWLVTTSSQPDINHQYFFGADVDGWQPVIGDWNGDGYETVGLYKDGVVLLRLLRDSQGVDVRLSVGSGEPGYEAIAGDWNGDGIDTIGLYKDGIFLFSNDNTTGRIDGRVVFGTGAGWQPIAGDWDGDFIDTVGVYKDGEFILADRDGSVEARFRFGALTGQRAVVGDWTASGIDSVGVYSNGMWALRAADGSIYARYRFGAANDAWWPVIGYFDNSALPAMMFFGLGATLAPPEIEATKVVEVTPDVTPDAEVTEVIQQTPVITPEAEVTDSVEPTPEITAEATETITEVAPEESITPEITPEVPESTPTEVLPEVTPEVPEATPTETLSEATPEVPEVTPTEPPVVEATPEVTEMP